MNMNVQPREIWQDPPRLEYRSVPAIHSGYSIRRGRSNPACLKHLLMCALFIGSSWSAHATLAAVSVQSPTLSAGTTTSVTTPVHFVATADSNLNITGYVVYVDGNNVYRNFSPSLDAWVVLAPGGTHSLFITAWDSSGTYLSTATYSINVTGVAPPTPPTIATRMANSDKPELFSWTVDNGSGVGGQCNDGSLGTFSQT